MGGNAMKIKDLEFCYKTFSGVAIGVGGTKFTIYFGILVGPNGDGWSATTPDGNLLAFGTIKDRDDGERQCNAAHANMFEGWVVG